MSAAESLMVLQNKETLMASLSSLEQDVQESVVSRLGAAGIEVRNALRDSLPSVSDDESRSSPGSVPYSQTGQLKKNIRAYVQPLILNEPITLKIYVGWRAFYGRMLEFGTSKMSARPWFYDGIRRKFPFLADNVEEALATVVARRNARK